MSEEITIVIPMRNEEPFVDRCLSSISEQLACMPKCEVLCVDGASTDGTRQLVLEYAAHDPRVRLIDNPAGIVPTAMNLGIRQARGEIIVRLDCHCEYAPDYLSKCLEVLRRTRAENAGGYVTTLPGRDSPVGRAIAAATSSRFGVGGSVFRTGGGEREVDTVPFGCFRRDVFDRVGLYDERLVRNQDIELNSRIRRGGGRIIISPAIRLKYFTRSTFTGLRQQAFHNGLWNPYTLYLVGGGLGVRHLVPLGFALSLPVLAVGGLLFQPFWLCLMFELLAYVLFGSLAAVPAARKSQTSALLVLSAFGQMHLAYGIGSIWGVLTAPIKFGLRHHHGSGEALPDRRD